MKKIIFAFLLVMFVSCTEKQQDTQSNTQSDTNSFPGYEDHDWEW